MAQGDPYISREQLKLVLGITDPSEDALIDRAVKGATRAIDNRTAYSSFWPADVAEVRRIDTTGRVVVRRGTAKLLLNDGIDPTRAFSVAGRSSASLMPFDAVQRGRPATAIDLGSIGSIPAYYDVTGFWGGWPEPPDDIVMATQLQSQRYYKRRGSPEGIAGSAEWGLIRVPHLDPDVRGILENGGYLSVGVG